MKAINSVKFTEPIDKFMPLVSEAEELSEKIREYIGAHMNADPENVSWGNVADAKRLIEDLKNIVEYIES